MLFILYRSLQPELSPKMRDMREQLWVFGVESHIVICDTVNFVVLIFNGFICVLLLY